MHHSWKTQRHMVEDAMNDKQGLSVNRSVVETACQRGVDSTIGAMQEMLGIATGTRADAEKSLKEFSGEQMRSLAAMAYLGFVASAQMALNLSEEE